ncbi:lipopolysaccharide biosynthesis protein [Gluconobacter thailandicus]|uniref:lipopolysaccharide biosynthesis protein n=1 Tax=Gluconobacter thailandicus TaxID=257438 RepID=UPI000A77717C|nr:oligosaccharide flippase family protein [Gluconobacter thailandicus]
MSTYNQDKGLLGRALSNLAWLLAGKGVGAVLSLIYLGLAVRTLKSEGFGQFTLIFGTAQAIAAIVSFQTWQIVIRYGVHHTKSDDNGPLSRLAGFCIGLDIAGAGAGCLLAWGGVILLAPLLGWSQPLSHAALAFCFVMLLSVRSTAVGLLRLHDRYGLGALADAVTPVVRFFGAVTAVMLDPTVTGFLIAWAIADIVTAIVYWVCVIRVMPNYLNLSNMRQGWRAPLENPGIWRFTWLTNLNSIIGTGCNNLLVLLVGIYTGAADAGQYRLAYQLSQALARVSEMFSRAVLPELARAHAMNEFKSIQKLLQRSTGLAIAATVTIILIVSVAGQPVLKILAGAAYLNAFPLLVVLGISASFDLIGVSFEPTLIATGYAGSALKVRLARTLVLFAAFAVLAPFWGAMGAAWSTMISSLLGLLLSGWAVWRAVGSQSRMSRLQTR